MKPFRTARIGRGTGVGLAGCKTPILMDDAALLLRAERRARIAKLMTTASLGPLLVIVLCAARSPEILLQGRLWAEESYFLSHALAAKSVSQQVFYVYRGHIELLTSIVFAGATHLSIGSIPLLTTFCGLLMECVLAFMVVFFRRELGIALAPALLVCVLIVVSPCAAENYLNMLNGTWLASAILLLMIHLPPKRLENHRLLVMTSTFVLGLSGIPATCLAPLAVLHSGLWRSRPHLMIASTLAVCALIQGALVFLHGAQNRFSSVSPWVYAAGPFLHIVVEHFLGVDAASALGLSFRSAAMGPAALPALMLAPLAALVAAALYVMRSGRAESRLLVVAFVYTTVFNITFAVGERNDLFTIYAMRYFFVPGFALALMLARKASVSLAGRSGVALVALILITSVSAKDFFDNPYNGMYVELRHPWQSAIDACDLRAAECSIAIDPGNLQVHVPAEFLMQNARRGGRSDQTPGTGSSVGTIGESHSGALPKDEPP